MSRVHVTEKYYIEIDTDYTPQAKLDRVDKDGKDVYKSYGYYSDFKKALNKILEVITNDKADTGEELELDQYISILNETHDKLEEVMEKVKNKI